ncbi:hypothetical protein MNEG_9844, partial [Monoraphidium neglectum]
MLQIIAGRHLPLGRLLQSSQAALGALHGQNYPQESCCSARPASTASSSSSSSSSSHAPAVDSTGPYSGRAGPTLQHAGPPVIYDVSVLIKSFELRFVKQASTVIRDLMLLCFTPKSIGALPEDLRKAWDQLGSVRDTDVALAVPLGDRALRTRRTIFTVIRGPHIHKTSREQFQRLVHRRVINFPTTSHEELQWFLDALKSYDFTGIQIQVKLGSSSFLMPPPLPDPARAPAAPARPLLARHMARFPHLFPAAALGGGAPSSSGGSSAAAMARDFEQSFATARADLVWERLALQQLPAF